MRDTVVALAGATWGAYGTQGVWLLVFAALLATCAVATAGYLAVRTAQAIGGSGARLFEELAEAHGLPVDDRALLRRAATGASHATLVFVDPSFLDRLGAAEPSDAVRCARLRELLFGE